MASTSDADRRAGLRPDPAGARPSWRAAASRISSSTWATLRAFSERFGEIQGPSAAPEVAKDDYAHVGTLSNLKEGGKYIGLPDAGQDWHTDMSYRDVMGFVNVLYGIRIPRRERRAARRHRVLQHARGLRRAAGRHQDAARRCDRDARLREILGAHAPRQGEHPPADDRRAAPPAAAGGASAVPHPPDHRPQGAVLQSRLHHADQ